MVYRCPANEEESHGDRTEKKADSNVTRGGRLARLEARISVEQKELFQQVRDSIQERTLTDFVISTLQEAANRILQEREIMHLSIRDRGIFCGGFVESSGTKREVACRSQRLQEMEAT